VKKLILVFLIALLGVSINAQTVVLRPLSDGLTQYVSQNKYNITNTTARIFTINATQDYATTQVFAIKMDTVVRGQTNVAVQLFGRETSLTAYSQIGSTVNWKLTTLDTTITIINATASQDQQFKVVLTGTGTGISRVLDMELKLNY
jgi:hypothetical protein